MAEKTKTALDNELREKSVNTIMELIAGAGEDVLQVAGNVFAFPTTDSAGNDAWVEITVKVPKGERLGKGEGFAGYDGYALADFYRTEKERKTSEAAARKAEAEAKKAKAEAKKAKVTVQKEDA